MPTPTAATSGFLPFPESVMNAVISFFSFLIITGLFASIYKALPSTRVAWKNVWPGAVITSFLFTTGKYLIGFYLGKQGIESSYGAAGSFIIFITWVYYSAQIFYLGAEFTKILADRAATSLLDHYPPKSIGHGKN